MGVFVCKKNILLNCFGKFDEVVWVFFYFVMYLLFYMMGSYIDVFGGFVCYV